MSYTEFFMEKLNKSLLYHLSIGSHTIVSINILEIFKNHIKQYKLYNTGILRNCTILNVQKCQDDRKRDLSWHFISAFFQYYPLTVYQDKS